MPDNLHPIKIHARLRNGRAGPWVPNPDADFTCMRLNGKHLGKRR